MQHAVEQGLVQELVQAERVIALHRRRRLLQAIQLYPVEVLGPAAGGFQEGPLAFAEVLAAVVAVQAADVLAFAGPFADGEVAGGETVKEDAVGVGAGEQFRWPVAAAAPLGDGGSLAGLTNLRAGSGGLLHCPRARGRPTTQVPKVSLPTS